MVAVQYMQVRVLLRMRMRHTVSAGAAGALLGLGFRVEGLGAWPRPGVCAQLLPGKWRLPRARIGSAVRKSPLACPPPPPPQPPHPAQKTKTPQFFRPSFPLGVMVPCLHAQRRFYEDFPAHSEEAK